MSDDFEDFLRAMPLREPSPALDRRVLKTLRSAPSRGLRWAAALLALIGLGLVALLWPGPAKAPPRQAPPDSPIQAQLTPTRRDSTLSAVSWDGVRFADDETPYYQVRVRRIQRTHWRDEQRGIEIHSRQPVQRVLYLPLPVD